MAGTCWILSSFIVLCAYLAVTECVTEIHTETVCFNNEPCQTDRYHTLTCDSTKRIAVHHAIYGFKSEARCPTISNCENMTDPFCCDTTNSGDCHMPFHQQGIDQIVEDCYGQSRCSFPSPKTKGSCSDSYVKVSSYSKLYYRCIAKSTIADFCSIETVRGESTFAVYDPRISTFKSGSCICHLESSDPEKKSNIQVYGVYMRLNGTTHDNQCTKLSIYDKDTAYVFGCDNDKKIEEDEKQQQSLLNTTTPITVSLALAPTSLPRYIWIGFEAKDSSNLVLRCRAEEFDPGTFGQIIGDAEEIDPDFVAAILFGVLIVVVVLAITLAGIPYYLMNLNKDKCECKKNGVVSNGTNGVANGLHGRRSSRDPKIYMEMEEAMNGGPMGGMIPMETRPYYSDTYEPKTNGKRKSEPKVVLAPEVPKAMGYPDDNKGNYLGMDSTLDRKKKLPPLSDEGVESDHGSGIYSEPFPEMSSFKDDNFTSPSMTSTLTMRSKDEEPDECYEAAFGDGSPANLRRPNDHLDADTEDEYLLPVTPDVSKDRRASQASQSSLQYECMPIGSKPATENRRRSLSYFVNQAFDVASERPPLPPPLTGREPLPDRRPLVETDDEATVTQDPNPFDNSEYFIS